jgi:hypothetical protein
MYRLFRGYSDRLLIGGNGFGCIENCYASSIVNSDSGSRSVGGLLGGCHSGYVLYSFATGKVNGDMEIGGLIGYNDSNVVSNCFAMGSANGGLSSYRIGGLIGWNDSGNVHDCYATGSVSGYSYVGGLIGKNWSAVNNCYAIGPVSGNATVGGFIGANGSTLINNCFWDTQTSGQSSSDGGIGKSTAEMKIQSTFTGWDFTNETVHGTSNFWRMCNDGVDYPKFNWQSKEGDIACPDGVSIEDLSELFSWWLSVICNSNNNYCGGTDFDRCGFVNLADFSIVVQHWYD